MTIEKDTELTIKKSSAFGTSSQPQNIDNSVTTTSEFGTIKSYSGNGYSLERMSAKDDYNTAALVAQNFKKISENPKTVDTVILVDINDKYAGALAGPLVGKYNAPILYTNGSNLNDTTEKAIKQLGIKNVVFISSKSEAFTSAISKLNFLGIKVIDKVIEKDKYDLSMKIAKSITGLREIHPIKGDITDDLLYILTEQQHVTPEIGAIVLPTKGRTVEDMLNYGGFRDCYCHSSYSDRLNYSPYELNYFNLYASNYFVKNVEVVMVNVDNLTDLITAMPLTVIRRAALVFAGDSMSRELAERSKQELLPRDLFTNPMDISKVYILGNTSVLKEGIEKQLRLSD